jgi:Leucine-rich repeat (LRR) protein
MFALNVEDNSFTSLDLSGVPTLEQLFCADNLLTSLNLSGLTELTYVECPNNSLTSLDVSGNEGIQELNCRNNSLTSFRAIGTVIGGYYSSTSSYGEGCDCRDNNLSATALDQFYSDLAPAVGAGILRVASNPGTSADDPTIATAKGYMVFGS